MLNSKLSVSQIKYLVAIYNINASETSLSEVAAFLGVSKASAHKMITTLDKIGLVEKELYGEISMTEKGVSIAEEIKENYLKVMHFFVEDMKLDPCIADKDALNFISYMSEELIDKFIDKVDVKNDEIYADRYVNSHVDFKNIAANPGRYEVPFKLMKYNGDAVSMGNKAIEHPCIIEISDKRVTVRLKAKKITHKSLSGLLLKGKLSRLCYWNGEKFLDARSENDMYSIPLLDIDSSEGKLGALQNGALLLQIHASVGVINMPVSEARLRLNLASRRKIS